MRRETQARTAACRDEPDRRRELKRRRGPYADGKLLDIPSDAGDFGGGVGLLARLQIAALAADRSLFAATMARPNMIDLSRAKCEPERRRSRTNLGSASRI